MKTKYTPAPWRIDTSPQGSFVMAGSYCIHRQGLSNADAANARLIAAAPELLEALDSALSMLATIHAHGVIPGAGREQTADEVKKVKAAGYAAISKAKKP